MRVSLLLLVLVYNQIIITNTTSTGKEYRFFLPPKDNIKKNIHEPNTALSASAARNRNSKIMLRFSRYMSSSNKIPNVEDDKRLVPSGSNPLHNR
ncbi:hypothetical protein ABFS82_10G139300 [Erythranthe guttata]|uniref:Uncharacterized protein n=1 Tax=Erythranthe guttata TaxID=4155 RepID=A0A022QGH8_ERYGU|nr:hypothetical protein MIMGU_mgv1a017074mg [Erythranthe guttata]